MTVKQDGIVTRAGRRNVCPRRPIWLEFGLVTVALSFCALLFGGPPLIGYGLALYFVPSESVPELILLGALTVWGAAMVLLLRHR